MGRKKIKLGVIEFHTPNNKALIEDFFKVIDGDRGFIVDVYLMDIKNVLRNYGYHLKIEKEID